MSRAFGDYEFKEGGTGTLLAEGVKYEWWTQEFADSCRLKGDLVVPDPAVMEREVSEEAGDEFLVAASDGLWCGAAGFCLDDTLCFRIYCFLGCCSVARFEGASWVDRSLCWRSMLALPCFRVPCIAQLLSCLTVLPLISAQVGAWQQALTHSLHTQCAMCRDFYKPSDAMQFARQSLKSGKSAQEVAEGLVQRALKRYTADNVSVIVLKFPWAFKDTSQHGKGAKRKGPGSK